MTNLRLGDIIDDYCSKCRRLTNHAVVSIVNDEPAKVRCRSCYHDHDYLREQIPPSKKDLKKLELFNAVLAGEHPEAAAVAVDEPVEEAVDETVDEAVDEPAEETVAEPVPEVAAVPAAPKKRGRVKKA